MTPKYLWADLETTGLDPDKDVILEVACIVTDDQLRQIGEPFEALVWNGWTEEEATDVHLGRQPQHMALLNEERNKIAKAMHEKNGLLAALQPDEDDYLGALWPDHVERALIEWLTKMPEGERLTLAGSSIDFDRGFLKKHMPAFVKRLTHRLRDVSSDKMMCRDAFGWEFPKAEAHRAMADVQESLGVARDIRSRLRNLANAAARQALEG